jgi:hypothetical protein
MSYRLADSSQAGFIIRIMRNSYRRKDKGHHSCIKLQRDMESRA